MWFHVSSVSTWPSLNLAFVEVSASRGRLAPVCSCSLGRRSCQWVRYGDKVDPIPHNGFSFRNLKRLHHSYNKITIFGALKFMMSVSGGVKSTWAYYVSLQFANLNFGVAWGIQINVCKYHRNYAGSHKSYQHVYSFVNQQWGHMFGPFHTTPEVSI